VSLLSNHPGSAMRWSVVGYKKWKYVQKLNNNKIYSIICFHEKIFFCCLFVVFCVVLMYTT
jgi:hypothetical protein